MESKRKNSGEEAERLRNALQVSTKYSSFYAFNDVFIFILIN